VAPRIETPLLLLRGWNDDDVEAWLTMNADPRVREFFARPYEREKSISDAKVLRQELERDGFGWFVVEIKNGMPFAGVIVLQPVPFHAHFTPANEIGWRFAVDAWGKGYATEAASAALRFAFDDLGWHEIVAFTAAINLRSRRVMERLGMSYDPADDFNHPRLEESHPLRRHVLYRLRHPHQAADKTG